MSGVTFTDAQFAALSTLLRRTAGLVFDDTRRDSLAYSVAERLRETRIGDVADYLSRLDDTEERQALLDEVTIQETHFFRNPPQVRALRDYVLPEIVRRAAVSNRRIRVWSAGCSTGEEPYTVAMLLRELLPDTTGWDVKVVATDISSRALAAAREGRYGVRALAMADPDDVARFFVLRDSGYEVRGAVRDLVEFRLHNLVTDAPPFGSAERVDLVLCRNVTIYFARETTRDLVGRLHGCLVDGGYLFLGHSETLWQVSEDFQLVTLGDAFVYRRSDGPERRRVLPDRRATVDDGPPRAWLGPERRQGSRRTPGSRTEDTAVSTLDTVRHDAQPDAGVLLTAPPAPPVGPVDPLLDQARAALAAGDYDGAAEQARLAAALDPMCAQAWYVRGHALVNAGRDREALNDLRKALYADPGAGFAHFLLAGTLARLGEAAAAARAYRAAAGSLGDDPADETAPELGGRSLAELVELCHRLADILDPGGAG